jgi:hypothetical protein
MPLGAAAWIVTARRPESGSIARMPLLQVRHRGDELRIG